MLISAVLMCHFFTWDDITGIPILCRDSFCFVSRASHSGVYSCMHSLKLKEGQNKEDIVFITLARCQVTFEKTAKEKKNLKLTETKDGVAFWLPSERRSLRPAFSAP